MFTLTEKLQILRQNNLHCENMLCTGNLHHSAVLFHGFANIADTVSVQRLVLFACEVTVAEHQRITVKLLRTAVGCPYQTMMLRFFEFQINESVFRICGSFDCIIEQIGKDSADSDHQILPAW